MRQAYNYWQDQPGDLFLKISTLRIYTDLQKIKTKLNVHEYKQSKIVSTVLK